MAGNDEPLFERDLRPPMSRRTRFVASVVWAGFLGATVNMIAVLVGWDICAMAADGPGFDALGRIFGVAWATALVPAAVAWALATNPRRRLRRG